MSKFEAPKPQNILEPADSKVTATTERNRPSTDQNLWENGWSCFYNPNIAFSCQKKVNVFLARNRANLDAKKTWFPAFSPPLRLFLKQRAPRTYSTQNNPKHVVFTTRLRIFCFLLPLRHRVPQEFVCCVGTFRVEPEC